MGCRCFGRDHLNPHHLALGLDPRDDKKDHQPPEKPPGKVLELYGAVLALLIFFWF
jgi:hypothetical protein